MLRDHLVFQLTSKNELVGYGTVDICDTHGENCTALPGPPGTLTGKRMIATIPTL